MNPVIAPKPYLPPYSTGFDYPPTPAGRTRCRHWMLDGECAWCLGHADVGDEQ